MFAHQLLDRTCANCHTPAEPLQAYCAECGCILPDLLPMQLVKTYQYGVKKHHEVTWLWGRSFFHNQAKLFFQNENDGCHLFVPILSEPVLLGRGADSRLPSSYVDLSSFGAGQLGMSRYHAQIEQKNNTLYLTDLSSSGGTCVDGVWLTPQAPQIVRNWSVIKFGKLKVHVRYA